jgi:hypothetical protein
MTFSVDPMDVLLPLLRSGLPGTVHVFSRVPDQVPEYLPLVVIRRTGGSSDAPTFLDVPWINVQCWAAAAGDLDAARNAHNLADDVRRVLWEAWANQTVTDAGWIARVRESSAPEEINDPDVPMFGRYQATYEIWIRKARALV